VLMRRVTTKDKLNNGLVRAALVAGVTSGVVAASLNGFGPANATCIGFSGIDIGSGCSSDFGTFALVLGEGTADAVGFFTSAIATGNNVTALSRGFGSLAYAGGDGTLARSTGTFNLAAAGFGFGGPLGVGTNVVAIAGDPNEQNLSFGNVALNAGAADFQGQNVVAAGYLPPPLPGVPPGPAAFNLASNFLGNSGPQPMIVAATGVGSSALNFIGNRNILVSGGILNNTTNVGNPFGFPNGSDNILTSTGNFSTAFNYQGFGTPTDCASNCGNRVIATGPGAIAGAINVVNEIVSQTGFGVNINNFGTANNTNVLAARSTNSATGASNGATTTLASGNGGNTNKSGSQLSGSTTKSGKQFGSSLKKLSAGVKNALGAGKKKKNSDPESD
jgi:hypothetical protein